MFALLAAYSSRASDTKLSWAEFRALFSWLGTLALAFGVIHQGLWGAIILKHIPTPSSWVGGGKIVRSPVSIQQQNLFDTASPN